MFVFGVDIPLVEIFFVLTFIMMPVMLVIIIMLIKNMYNMKQTVDELLDESIILKHEIRETRLEENEQLKEMHKLTSRLDELVKNLTLKRRK